MKNNCILTFVIVSYKSYDDIMVLLKSVEKQDRKPDHIVIVDNCSPNGDGERLQDIKSKNTHVICAERNGGFAYGCNIGITKALELGSTHIGLLNPDAILTDVGYGGKIAQAFHTSSYSIFGTYVRNVHSKKIEFGGARLGKFTLYPKILHRNEGYHGNDSPITSTDYATGSSLFFTRELYKEIGPLDESYFMYFEETDYCLRAKKAGYTIGILPATYIDHNTSSSVGRMSWFYVKYMIRNFLKFGYHHLQWYQIPGFLLVYCFFWVPGFLFKYITR